MTENYWKLFAYLYIAQGIILISSVSIAGENSCGEEKIKNRIRKVQVNFN